MRWLADFGRPFIFFGVSHGCFTFNSSVAGLFSYDYGPGPLSSIYNDVVGAKVVGYKNSFNHLSLRPGAYSKFCCAWYDRRFIGPGAQETRDI